MIFDGHCATHLSVFDMFLFRACTEAQKNQTSKADYLLRMLTDALVSHRIMREMLNIRLNVKRKSRLLKKKKKSRITIT